MKNHLLRTIIVTSAEQRWTEKGARNDTHGGTHGGFIDLYVDSLNHIIASCYCDNEN